MDQCIKMQAQSDVFGKRVATAVISISFTPKDKPHLPREIAHSLLQVSVCFLTESKIMPMSRNHYHDYGAAWHQDTGTAIVMGKSDAHFMGSHICSTIHHRIMVSLRTTPRT